MDEILSDLEFAFIYMDDVLVASRNLEEHYEHFRVLFRRLTEHDLVVSPAKCQFGQSKIEFLGHTVSKDGIEPLPGKVAAIAQFPKPSTTEELTTATTSTAVTTASSDNVTTPSGILYKLSRRVNETSTI